MFSKIIFITYINRSGTTFLVNNLSKSEEILVCPEAEILIDLFLNTPAKIFHPDKRFSKKLYDAIRTDNKLKYWGLSEEDIIHGIINEKTFFEAFIKFIDIYRKKVKPKSSILVFKAEKLILFYTKIKPLSVRYNIKFLAVIRDCRAIFYSQNNTLIPGTDRVMETNSLRLAKRWNTYMELVKQYTKSHDFIAIYYESLIKDFNYYFKFVCERLNIRLFDYSRKGDLKYRMPASQINIHEIMENSPEINRINIWQSRIGLAHLYILELISGKILKEYGYKQVNVKMNMYKIIIQLTFEYFSFLFSRFYKTIKYL